MNNAYQDLNKTLRMQRM